MKISLETNLIKFEKVTNIKEPKIIIINRLKFKTNIVK
jgi:hypothetical protein